MCVAGLCAAAMALTWLVASRVPAGRFKDAVALHDFTLLSHPFVDTVGNTLLHLLDPAPFIAYAIALIAVALRRRRLAVALAVAAVMGLAPLTSELLKPLLAHTHDQVGGLYIASASWPSGHATAAAALALSAVLVAPVRLRPLLAVLGVLLALAVGCSLLILAWHMPSDVVGGYLVAALWMSLALAGVRAWDARSRRPRGLGARSSVASPIARAPLARGVRARVP
jgi:membrane-associated phospholipid phosphatase